MSNTDLKIGFIGVGNAGTQVGIQAYYAGYDTIVLNTSKKDLAEDVLPKEVLSYVLGDQGRGTGKNRGFAKETLKGNLTQLFAHPGTISLFENSDVIVVCAATGGGTGSGMSPLLCNRILASYEDKIVIFYGILPKATESMQTQYNTLECINEVHKLGLPYMLADLDKFTDLDDQGAHQKVANHIITSLNVLRGDKMLMSKHGMIDERDEMTIISAGGYMAVYTLEGITKAKLDTATMAKMVLNEAKSSAAADAQNDKIVKYLGVMVSAPEEFDDPLMKADFTELYNVMGTPYDTFYNPHINNDTKASIAVIVSGMTIPANRIQDAIDKLTEFENSRKAKEVSVDLNFASFGKGSITDMSSRKQTRKPASLEDIPDFL